MRCTSFLLAVTAVGATASAQDYIGFSYNGQVGATSRGSLGNNAGEVMTRIDGSDYAGWGTDTPGMRTISSIFCVAQDQTAQPVAATFDIRLYPEDVANPGYPDMTQGVPFATGLSGPTGTGGVAAIVVIATPASPVAVPILGGGDVFVSFVLPAVTATSSLSIQIQLGYQPNTTFTVYDLPGPAQPPAGVVPTPTTVQNTHGVTFVGGMLILNARRNQLIDVAHSGTGGVVLTSTNQASLLGSANPPPTGFGPAPGTGGFLSGVSPDANGWNAGRVDDITFDYYKTGMPAGSLVLFAMTLTSNFLAAEPPLPAIGLPGTGVLCLDPSDPNLFLNILFPTTVANEAFWTTTFPAAIRPLLPGYRFNQQAFWLDLVTGNWAASPCGAQAF
ncbi:MAG TPA: hypothetical protein VFZ65_19565 [Planctomycetota bacterium]|nr:hypothetical protein [Planctomycetota bacterium]